MNHNSRHKLFFSTITGGGILFHITKRAMVKKDYKELDEAIKAKIQPFLYNAGKGKMVPTAQLSMIRNRDRSKSKQVWKSKSFARDHSISRQTFNKLSPPISDAFDNREYFFCILQMIQL